MKTAALLGLLCLVALQAGAQLRRADRKFDRFLYAQAAPLYLKYLKSNPEDWTVIDRIGDTYRLMNDSEHAELWYGKGCSNPGSRVLNFLYYGQALMNNRKWESAVPWLEKYYKSMPEDPIALITLNSARNYQMFMRDSSLYTVVHLEINTKEADFGTSYGDSNMVTFASARKYDRFLFGWLGTPFLDLYNSTIDGMKLEQPSPVRGKVNSRYHEGGQTYSPDGQVMFFSRNNYIKGKVGQSKEGVIRLKTYRAELRNGRWTKIRGIPFNNNEYSVGHPALSADGKMLYFVSDQPSSNGGTDIYVVNLDIEKKTWGEPVNLGPTVNTVGNEMFPWISPEGTLYFASNGHKGLGGLDIFETKGLSTSIEEVKNIGYPINSARDDFALIYDTETNIGFFSSNRVNGTGDDDIYGFSKKQVLHGVVVDAETGKPIDDARVELFDPKTFQLMSRTDRKGDFRQGLNPNTEYYVVASKEGYKDQRQVVKAIALADNDEVVIRIPMEKVQNCEEKYTLLGKVSDDGGKPVAGKRVTVTTQDWVAVTDDKGQVHLPLLPNMDFTVKIDEPGKATKPYTVSTKGVEPGSEVEADLYVGAMDSGKVFYIIYYDFDKHNIREGDARPELDRVVNFMLSNPDVRVQLTSHTDCRATNEYNVTLSKNRAIDAFNYIVNHGIEKDRLTYTWKGETELTNGCADGVPCTEEEHQRNRRTEFTIMGSYRLPK